jgi:hypothetical protein
MNKNIRAAFCLIICILLFFGVAVRTYVEAADDVVVTVGDNPITTGDIKEYMEKKKSIGQKNLSVEQALNDLVVANILMQESLRRKIHERKNIKSKLNQCIASTVTQQLIAENIGSRHDPVSEEDARKLYNENWRNSRYPRLIDLSRFYIRFKDDSLKETAMDYAGHIRAKMIHDDYKDTNEFIKKIRQEIQTPNGIIVNGYDDKDLMILSFKRYFPSYWLTASSLKEGEVSSIDDDLLPGQLGIYKVVAEKPKVEVPFETVISEIMNTLAYESYASKLEEFVDSVKAGYQINYLKNPSDISFK